MRPLLVTAGATRNPIDAIRYLSAASSGRTGVELACAQGAGSTTLLGSPEALWRIAGEPSARGIDSEPYGSTRDLMARMQAWCSKNPTGVVVHAAAVGDYEAPAEDGKIPSGLDELVLRLRPAPKILDAVRGWSAGLSIISFKAAPPGTSPERLSVIAHAQRTRTDSEIVFANAIGNLSRDVLLATGSGTTHHAAREDGLRELLSRVRDLRQR